MVRSCERPGCRQEAEVAFGFQAEPYVVWLDRLRDEHEMKGRAGVLCRRHADSMVVPIGWSLDDRRQPVPQLFAPAAVEAPVRDVTGPVARPARAKRRRTDAAPSLFDIEADVDVDVDVDVEADVDDAETTEASERPAEHVTDATPWRPVFDTGDDLGGLLSAKTPLLARAFRGEPPARRDR